jgi:DHA1 family bicyclomycin/chloramphenicol resistance-like MFS transporter
MAESAASIAEPPRGDRARLLLVLGSLYALAPLAIDMYLPGLPALAHGLHASASQGQLTLTSCLLGLGIGQLFAGPISDSRGRRPPLLVGMAAFAVASFVCALAPSNWALIVLRFVEGLAGAIGMVIVLAIIRDSFEGRSAARAYALLILVSGVAPVVAPLIGAQILRFSSWRGVFVGLGAAGLVLLLAVAWALTETLRTLGALLGDRRFMPFAGTFALMFAAMFAYIAGSSFVFENIYGLSPELYSVVFAANAAGLVAMAQVGRQLVGRLGPLVLMRVGLTMSVVACCGIVVCALTHGSLALALASFAVLLAANGLNVPNTATLALQEQRERAGSASALLGFGQFSLGAAAAPLVGLAGSRDMLPMAVVIAACVLVAVALQAGNARGVARRTV